MRICELLLAVALGGCSLTVSNADRCESTAECRSAFGLGSACGDDGFCRPALPSPRCARTFPPNLLTEPETFREVQRMLFRKHHLVALGGDLIFGRIHDHPLDKYTAVVDPPRFMQYIQDVQVPAPDGGTRPLAEPPVALIEYLGPQVIEMPSITTPLVTILAMLLLGVGGARAYRRLPGRTRGAGLWLILYPLVSGLLGALLLAVFLFAGVDELRENENILVFPATDLLLVVLGARWLRRPLRGGERRLLSGYAAARMALLGLVVALHVVGVFYQRPWVFVALSSLYSGGLLALARRARG